MVEMAKCWGFWLLIIAIIIIPGLFNHSKTFFSGLPLASSTLEGFSLSLVIGKIDWIYHVSSLHVVHVTSFLTSGYCRYNCDQDDNPIEQFQEVKKSKETDPCFGWAWRSFWLQHMFRKFKYSSSLQRVISKLLSILLGELVTSAE